MMMFSLLYNIWKNFLPILMYFLTLGWFGTYAILIGLIYMNSKKASNPKTRVKAQLLVIFGSILLGIFAFSIGAYEVMSAQIGVILISIWGMINNKNEIKKSE